MLGKALPSRLQALKALRFPGMRNSIAKNSHKRTFKKSTTFAVAMQNLGLRSGSRNRKTPKKKHAPLKHEVEVQICQNAIEPAKLDFGLSVFPKALHGFSFQLRAVLNYTAV